MRRTVSIPLLAAVAATVFAAAGCGREDDKPVVVQPNTTPLDTTVRADRAPDQMASAKDDRD